MQSWGRKKRSIGADKRQEQIGKQLGDDMTLSREILVLDLKEKSASADAAPGDSTTGAQDEANSLSLLSDGFAQKAPLKSSGWRAAQTSGEQLAQADGQPAANQPGQLHCLTSQSLLLITCSIGCFFVLYVCLVAYFFARRDAKISVIKHQYH